MKPQRKLRKAVFIWFSREPEKTYHIGGENENGNFTTACGQLLIDGLAFRMPDKKASREPSHLSCCEACSRNSANYFRKDCSNRLTFRKSHTKQRKFKNDTEEYFAG